MEESQYESRIDARMRALKEWSSSNLPSKSRRRGLLEALTSTYWMFRMGPRHCWWFGKGFPMCRARAVWSHFHKSRG